MSLNREENERLWRDLLPLVDKGECCLLSEKIPYDILQAISREIHSTGFQDDWKRAAAFLGSLTGKDINYIEYLSSGVDKQEAMMVTFNRVEGLDLSKLLNSLHQAELFNVLQFIYDRFNTILLEVVSRKGPRPQVIGPRMNIERSASPRPQNEFQQIVLAGPRIERIINQTLEQNSLDSGFNSLDGPIEAMRSMTQVGGRSNLPSSGLEPNKTPSNSLEVNKAPSNAEISAEIHQRLSEDFVKPIPSSGSEWGVSTALISREPSVVSRARRDLASSVKPGSTDLAIRCDSVQYIVVESGDTQDHGPKRPPLDPGIVEGVDVRNHAPPPAALIPPPQRQAFADDVMVVFVPFHADAAHIARELIARLESRGILSLTLDHLESSGVLIADKSLLTKYISESEVSYVVPVLSRGYLREIQTTSSRHNSANKYIYLHCLAEYSETCLNFRWMPVMSSELAQSTTVRHLLKTSCHVLKNYFLMWERFDQFVKVLRNARQWRQR